jgi:hydrogenase expression/formation protein HypE
VALGDRAAGVAGERDDLRHRDVRQRHERQDVERADARMDAAMLPHVDLGHDSVGERARGVGDGGRRAQEREHGAVVIGIGVDVGERDARRGAHRRRKACDARQIAALAHVRHALDDGAPRHHGILTSAMPRLPLGKLPGDLLQAILDKHAPRDPRVIVGPRVGEDAAVIDIGERYLVVTSDPITFATDELGWYALHVNANDIVVRGATPRWFLATLLLPAAATDETRVRAVFEQLAEACEELEVALVGGHTEVTHGLDRPIIAGTMLGEVAKDRLVTTGGARVGDAIVLTKGVPLEGAAIIAREKEAELRARGVPAATIRRAKGFLRAPGISVRPEAELACELAQVHAMHDPTEGGIATALHELADAAGVGLRIDRDRIMVLPEGRALCEAFGLDPLGTIASGALLLTLSPPDAGIVIHALARESIDCHFIGQVVDRAQGVVLVDGTKSWPLPVFPRDEIARLFEEA